MSDDILSLYVSLQEEAVSVLSKSGPPDRTKFYCKLFNFFRSLEEESKVMGQRIIGMLIYIHYQCTEKQVENEIPYRGKWSSEMKCINFNYIYMPDDLILILSLYIENKLLC